MFDEALIRDMIFLSPTVVNASKSRPASYLDGGRGDLEKGEGMVPDMKENDERMGLWSASLRDLRANDLVGGVALRFFEYYGGPRLKQDRGWS